VLNALALATCDGGNPLKELKAKLLPVLGTLNSSTAEDKDSVTVNSQTTQKHKLTSIADLKAVAGQLTIGGPSEFKTCQQGWSGWAGGTA
jgi:osmoprotectant transport system substrate-binding protein